MPTTKELVYIAAEELLSEGIKPSQQLVREKIGKGSATTIHRALNEWWVDLGKRLKYQDEKDNGIPVQVQRALDDLWAASCKQAAIKQQEDQKKFLAQLRTEKAILSDEKQLFTERTEKLSEQLEKAYDRIDKLQNELESLQEKNLILEKQLYQNALDINKYKIENKVLDKIVKDLNN